MRLRILAPLVTIAIVAHAERWKDAVETFNRRMRLAGSSWGWYVDPTPPWLERKSPSQTTWREYWLALEDGAHVRGGYALRPQSWRVRGRPVWITDWQGPVSEGAISRKYNSLGLRMIRDMLKKRPLLYSWGHGGEAEPIVRMLRRMGWLLHPTPFAIKVLDPYRFLRLNESLRLTAERRMMLDALAVTGLGTIGTKLVQRALALREGKRFHGSFEEVPSFGSWADEVWERAEPAYHAVSVRDAATMNLIMPSGQTPPEWQTPTRLRVRVRGRDVGWIAVGAAQMKDDPRYGELKVGTLYDYFAHPDDAGEVVRAGLSVLADQKVDVVTANQAHPAWHRAMRANGFLLAEDRRFFAVSPQLRETLAPFDETMKGLFLTNMDGHGPMGL